MRVLVCGGRDYTDLAKVISTLDALDPRPTHIIEGGATGADSRASHWAYLRGVPCKTYPANWREHGRSAGPIRNRLMLTDGKPDLVVAFPGGAGTESMIEIARNAGVRVMEIK